MRSIATRILRSLVISATLVATLLVGCQSKLIYHPRSYDRADLRALEHAGGMQLVVQTSQGRQTAFYLPPRSPSSASGAKPFLWIVCGGNGSLSLDYLRHCASWPSGFAYLFVDYPAYGLCEGSPTPEHIRETMVALQKPVADLFGESTEQLATHTGILGHSLGCAAGLICAEEWKLSGAVLCAPFTTMTDMARKLLGTPLCYLNHHRFNNVARLASLEKRGGKAWLFHGSEDEVIPADMSRQLAASFPTIIQLKIIEGSMHNDILDDAGDEIAKAMLSISGKK